MADAKAEEKGGGYDMERKGGDAKGGGGDGAKGGPAEAKGGGGDRQVDTICSDSDYSRSSGDPEDVKNIRTEEICIIKRSDGSWKYGRLFKFDGALIEVIATDDDDTKLFSEGSDWGAGVDSQIRKLDCGGGSK